MPQSLTINLGWWLISPLPIPSSPQVTTSFIFRVWFTLPYMQDFEYKGGRWRGSMFIDFIVHYTCINNLISNSTLIELCQDKFTEYSDWANLLNFNIVCT